MIRILAKEYSQAVQALCVKLDKESAAYDVYFTRAPSQLSEMLTESVSLSALILVGDTGRWCNTFAQTFGLALVYDKFAEQNIRKYCKLSGLPLPAQYLLDKYCMQPETFIHSVPVYGFQCGCMGEYGKCHVYIMPDNSAECESIFDNYLAKDLFHSSRKREVRIYKIFGLSARDLEDKLAKLNSKIVTLRSETVNLDSKVTLTFASGCSPKAIALYLQVFCEQFGDGVYADGDESLAQKAVHLLAERYKTVATAESITGGMIASAIVDVPGASSVLYEGCVTYSVDSKCDRLGINPHFVDEHGVVSPQVAREMALAQLKFAGYSLSTTGYAGPSSENGMPVGLCYIGVGCNGANGKYVKVFKNVFAGDRNSIRQQVANTALYLLCKSMTNSDFFN